MLSNIVLIVSFIILFVLGLAVIANNHKQLVNQLFSLFTFSGCLWVLANILINASATGSSALFYSRAALAPAAAVSYFFLLFSFIFPHGERLDHRLTWLAGIPIIGVFIMSPTPYNIVSAGPYGSPLVTGVLYPVALFVLFALVLTGIGRLFYSERHAKGRERLQLMYILVAVAATFIPGLIFNGVFLVFGESAFGSVGPAVVVIFALISTIAIVKHSLLDIRLIVARSVAYILLLATLAGLYGAAIFGISSLLFVNNRPDLTQNIIYIALAIILAFTFQPLRRFFEKLTDRIFFRDRYDSQEVLNTVGKTLAEEIKLEPLLNTALKQICQSLRIEIGQFVIFDNRKIYKVAHYGPLPSKILVVGEMAKLRKSMLITDELEEGERKQILDTHGVRVSLMLRTHDAFVGFLFLGDKLSGDIYSNQDLRLLEILAQELSIAIINAKAYEEISRFNLTLQQKVNEATARLRVANRNLKALDKAKDEFISMASHQLRTPLTTIKGYLSMILEGDAGEINTQEKEFLNYAFEGAERMVALISDLLNVSRLSAGRFVIERKPTDLVAVTADEVRQLKTHADAKSLELMFTPPQGKVPLVNLDEGKTRQVIMNFIDNAIYYTKTGGVYVTLRYESSKVKLQVRDTGIGVPETAKKKLFTKFYRAENAQIARPDGTGLGLYLAKRVVDGQGGSIIFESKEGQGSTFGFSLPTATTKSEPSKSVKLKVKTPK